VIRVSREAASRGLTRPEDTRVVKQDQTLDGGDVLPGFELSLKKLFAELPGE